MKDRFWQIWAFINYFGFRCGMHSFISFLFQKYSRGNTIYIKNKYFNYGITLRKNSSDFVIFREVFLAQEYGFTYPENIRTIIDCGANIGFTSIYFVKKFPEAKIICIEPDTENYLLLLKNTRSYSNIYCINAGIWYKSQMLAIENPNAEKSAIRLQEFLGNSENIVSAKSVLDIMNDFNLPQIDLLKIDIEGSEVELFSLNAIEWLNKTKTLIVELHDRIRDGCFNAFINAIQNRKMTMNLHGDNIMCQFNDNQ